MSPAPIDPDGPTWKLIALGAWAIVTALFSWFAKGLRDEQREQRDHISSTNKRLDDTVSKQDFRDELTRMREERDAQHRDNRDERIRLHSETVASINELARKIDTQSVQDQRILQCERDIATVNKYAEDLKHLNIDPYVNFTARLDERIKALEKKGP